MNQRGFMLIEMLVASMLLSIAGAGLYTGLVQAIKTDQRIRHEDKLYDPVRIFQLKIEKDLRNAVILRDDRFQGKEQKIQFTILKQMKLYEISYEMKHKNLVRSEREITTHLVKEDPKERVTLKDANEVKFLYSYLDEEDKLAWQEFWIEEPYFGIPRAVKVEWKQAGESFSKLISIPQGKWGRIASE